MEFRGPGGFVGLELAEEQEYEKDAKYEPDDREVEEWSFQEGSASGAAPSLRERNPIAVEMAHCGNRAGLSGVAGLRRDGGLHHLLWLVRLAVGGGDPIFPTVGFPMDLALPKFDTSLGALTGIQITVTTDAILQADVFNIGPAAAFTGAYASGTIQVDGPNGAASSVTLETTPFSGSLATGTFSTPTYDLGPAATGVGSGVSDVSPANFGLYEYSGGSPDWEASLDAAFASTFYSGTGGVFFGGRASAYGSVEVDYTYTAPEAWTLWPELSLIGVCGVAGLDRARRARFCAQGA